MKASLHYRFRWAWRPVKHRSTHWVLTSLAKQHSLCRPAQKTVALSSTEAKYMAMFGHIRQLCGVVPVSRNIGSIWAPTTYCVAPSRFDLYQIKIQFRMADKPIDIRYHYICKCIEDGKVSVTSSWQQNIRLTWFTKTLAP